MTVTNCVCDECEDGKNHVKRNIGEDSCDLCSAYCRGMSCRDGRCSKEAPFSFLTDMYKSVLKLQQNITLGSASVASGMSFLLAILLLAAFARDGRILLIFLVALSLPVLSAVITSLVADNKTFIREISGDCRTNRCNVTSLLLYLTIFLIILSPLISFCASLWILPL